MGNGRKLTGRVTSVHKVLVSGSEVAKRSDVWLGKDGGVIMPDNHVITIKMREYYDKLVQQHGTQGFTLVYLDKGVYVFDFFPVPAADLSPVEARPGSAPQFPNGRQAQMP